MGFIDANFYSVLGRKGSKMKFFTQLGYGSVIGVIEADGIEQSLEMVRHVEGVGVIPAESKCAVCGRDGVYTPDSLCGDLCHDAQGRVATERVDI